MLDGKKNVEIRLADFEINAGDEILFREWDQTKHEYTGREFKKRVKVLFKVRFTDFNSIEEIKQHGHYVMELESIEKQTKSQDV